MEIKFTEDEIIETKGAIGYKVSKKGKMILWIPKGMITNTRWFVDKVIEIPDWFYDKKVNELFNLK